MANQTKHGRTPQTLGYMRKVTPNEFRILSAAAIFSRHLTAQRMIDHFLTRVERRTIEMIELYREQNVELRRMVDRAVEEEISTVLSAIEAGVNRRFGQDETQPESVAEVADRRSPLSRSQAGSRDPLRDLETSNEELADDAE